MSKTLEVLGAIALVSAVALPLAAQAADQALEGRVHAVRSHVSPCDDAQYDCHPELLYTYAGNYDPRYTLTMEPRYLFGRVRAYRSVWSNR
jgi:hypothetical protein